jgi:hypothetical protein
VKRRSDMKAYVTITGILFGLLTLAHGYEVVDRGRLFGSDVVVVGVAASLAVWAWRVSRTLPPGGLS